MKIFILIELRLTMLK